MKNTLNVFVAILGTFLLSNIAFAQDISTNSVIKPPYIVSLYHVNQSTGAIESEVPVDTTLRNGYIYYFTITPGDQNAANIIIETLSGAEVSGAPHLKCASGTCSFTPWPVPLGKNLGWIPNGINGFFRVNSPSGVINMDVYSQDSNNKRLPTVKIVLPYVSK